MNALTPHIGHRATLKDERHLRCVDCDMTLVLEVVTTSIPTLDQSCDRHPGQWPVTCGPCRAERIGQQRQPDHQPTADVPARVAEAKALLRARKAER